MREEVEPMTDLLGRLITILDVIGLEAFIPEAPRGVGRPPEDRRGLARAFVAKAVLGIPTTSALIDRLGADKSLRRVCSWGRRVQVPCEATFSRAFTEFAQGNLPDKMHAALIDRALSARIIGAIARDASQIEARENLVEKDDPPPPSASVPPQNKRGAREKAKNDQENVQSRNQRAWSVKRRRPPARCPRIFPPLAMSAPRKTVSAYILA